jgi:hypothetical protein
VAQAGGSVRTAFLKKAAKNFCLFGAQAHKVFLLLFLQKKKAFLPPARPPARKLLTSLQA